MDTLRIRRRALGGAAGAPTALGVGELAFNEVDGGLYIGRSNASVAQVNGAVGGGGVTIADAAPSSPTQGALWWESDSGTLYLYYNDGTSAQWVAASGGGSGTTATGGQLTYVSATLLKFVPYQGNGIRLNGLFRLIPSAGIVGLANTNVFVNGVSGQNLAANTTYWIFVFDNAGTLTADFRTSATHATSTTPGNEGVEILTGDNTRSLIGLCRTNASSQFFQDGQNIAVLSWFNRQSRGALGAFTTNRTSASTTAVEINAEIRVNFLSWGDTVQVNLTGAASLNALGSFYTAVFSIDQGAFVDGASGVGTSSAAGYWVNIGGASIWTPGEGWHTLTLYATLAGSGTITYVGIVGLTYGGRCALSVRTQG
jgi:hypothetical protein